jgi:hypothetical protein
MRKVVDDLKEARAGVGQEDPGEELGYVDLMNPRPLLLFGNDDRDPAAASASVYRLPCIVKRVSEIERRRRPSDAAYAQVASTMPTSGRGGRRASSGKTM